jgi:hypothetical protein
MLLGRRIGSRLALCDDQRQAGSQELLRDCVVGGGGLTRGHHLCDRHLARSAGSATSRYVRNRVCWAVALLVIDRTLLLSIGSVTGLGKTVKGFDQGDAG